MGSRNKEKDESKGMEKYITGEDRIVKVMQEIGGEIEERICKQMDKMTDHIEQIRREWKEEKKKLEKRLENLE